MHVILHFSEHIEFITPRGSPNIHHGLWLTVVYPCRSSTVLNIPFWCWMLMTGEWGGGDKEHVETAFSAQFCCEPNKIRFIS
jgi:hypothetical protein